MRNEDFTFRSPFFFFLEVPIKRVLLGLGKWFMKMFSRIIRASQLFSGKISIRAHFPAGMQVQIISGPESSLLGAKALMVIERTQLSGAIQETAE